MSFSIDDVESVTIGGTLFPGPPAQPETPLPERSHFTDPRTGGPLFHVRYQPHREKRASWFRDGVRTALPLLRAVCEPIREWLAERSDDGSVRTGVMLTDHNGVTREATHEELARGQVVMTRPREES